MTNPVKILLGNLKTILSFGSSNANKNVVTDTNGDLKVEDKNNHAHGQIDKDGKVSTTTSSVGNVVVTDSNNIIKTINKLPAANVTHQDITGKLDKSQTSYKGKNVVVHSISGEITFEDKNNHTHTVSNITDFPPIIEKIPFFWVDDFLTYASNSYNIFYDPNNDVQYLMDFINSNDNDSGFTSDDIETDRLYRIRYGSSYNHNIYVAFYYDKISEEYNAYYVTTTERYATLYELSLKADASHSHSNYISKTSSDTGFLKSNGNIDSNTYLTTSSASSTYLTQSSASSTYIPLSARKTTVTSGDTTGVPTGDAVYKAIDATLDNIITQLRS